ncbi:MAG: hypothetical protein KME13_11440 [Myxacorys californica WJT36-NPBG1]|jgi:hypothetical protein|nr:hypothetical protein [Myxacorys californica WJT36-NPBG1]
MGLRGNSTSTKSQAQSTGWTAHNQPSPGSDYYGHSEGKATIQIFLKGLYVLAICAGLYFAYLNINPYVQIVRGLLAQTDLGGFGQFIARIPLVGAVAGALGESSTWIFGFVLWGLLQAIELFPLVVGKDKALMRTALEAHDTSHKFRVNEKDDPVAASLKVAYNKLPLGILRNMGKFRIAAYIIDLIICFTVYPPCDGGFLKFLLYLSTGAFSRLNWSNIVLSVVTLFAVEIIVELLFGIGALIFYYRKSRQS